jgi:hypothetical protein
VYRWRWRAQTEAGIAHPDRDDTFFVANLAVTCSPYQRGEQLAKVNVRIAMAELYDGIDIDADSAA